MTPPAGEGGGAHAVADGEVRDDGVEDLDGEGADQIDFLQLPRLLGNGDFRRRHHGRWLVGRPSGRVG